MLFFKLREIFAPPHFEDESKNPPASILNVVLLISMGGLFVTSILTAFVSDDPFLASILYGAVAISLIPLYVLMHQGYIGAVGVLLMTVLWGVLTVVTVFLGGLEAPTLSTYLVLIVIAALLFGVWGGGVMAGLSVITLVSLYITGRGGLLPDQVEVFSDGVATVIHIGNALLVMIFIGAATNTINRFLRLSQIKEEALRHSIEDLKQTTVSKNYVDNILQSMSNLLIVLNSDGTINTVNQAALSALGYHEAELIGQRYNDLILAEDDLADGATATRLMRAVAQRDIDTTYRAKDGRLIPVMLSSSALSDMAGNVQGVVCVAQDMTERKRTEAQLSYQASLLAAVSDAIVSTEMDLSITSWNKSAEEMYGYDAADVLGKRLTDVVPTTMTGTDNDDIIKQQYIKRGHWQNEVTQVRRDGTQMHVLSSVSVLHDEVTGKPKGMVTINHDITKRIVAEQALQKRADQLALLRRVDAKLSSTLEIDAVLQIALEAAVSMSGAEAGFIVLMEDDGNRIAQTLGGYKNLPHKDAHLYGITARTIRTRQAQFVPDVKADADYVTDLEDTVALIALPLISVDQMLGAINLETERPGQFTQETFDLLNILAARIATAVDNARLYAVSQQQLAELQELYTQVSKLEQLKTDMIRIASHDLRNPVGIINGYVQLLEVDLAERVEPEAMEFLAQIRSSTERMNEIATNILSLERIQQAAREEYKDPVDLVAMVKRVVEKHEQEAKMCGLRLEVAADLIEAVRVAGDDQQLYEAITNYVTNAIKYTPSGGVIQVAAYVHDDRARVEVRDTGYGIPAELQERLFEPFFRAERDATEHIDGVGLGLHLVKNIVERHQGAIFFDSVVDQGSTFGFELPLMG